MGNRFKQTGGFSNYAIETVAQMSDAALDALLDNPAIIRHRAKIYATRTNARAFLRVQAEYGSFDRYLWSWVGGKTQVNSVSAFTDLPSQTPLSKQIAADLKKRGFAFVGPVCIYSYLQAAGLINDHENHCAWK